jgi:hypothetical protein
MSDVNVDRDFHPEQMIPGLVFIPAGEIHMSAEDEEKFKGVRFSSQREKKELCRACGWNTDHELISSYLPRIRMFYTKPNAGLWTMGNDYMIWDRACKEGMDNEFMTYQFLKAKGVKNIPLVEEMQHFGKPGDKFQFTVTSRAKGKALKDVWHTASREEKRSYADQMIAALRELRTYTAPYPQRVDGSPLVDNLIGQCLPNTACKSIGKTTEDWLDSNLGEELRRGLGRKYGTSDKAVIEEKLNDLKNNFPEGAPYVLTHGDIHCGNIIVNNGKIQAIIDWEAAGYYPWWVERMIHDTRTGRDGCPGFYQMVWRELDSERRRPQWESQVCQPVNDVQVVFRYCPTTHDGMKRSDNGDEWRRPAWCECNPIGGRIRRWHWEAERTHEIDYSETAEATYNPRE